MEYSYSFGNAIIYNPNKISPRSKEDEPEASILEIFQDSNLSTRVPPSEAPKVLQI